MAWFYLTICTSWHWRKHRTFSVEIGMMTLTFWKNHLKKDMTRQFVMKFCLFGMYFPRFQACFVTILWLVCCTTMLHLQPSRNQWGEYNIFPSVFNRQSMTKHTIPYVKYLESRTHIKIPSTCHARTVKASELWRLIMMSSHFWVTIAGHDRPSMSMSWTWPSNVMLTPIVASNV